MAAQEERVRKGKEFGKEGKRREKKGKSGLREKSVFLLLCDCVFHSIFPPFQSTMPPLFFLRSHSHTTVHTTPSHTTHTQARLCAVLFLFLCVTVSALIPHSIKQHNTMQPCNHHTWHNQWMMQWVNGKRTVVIEDTTPQTPSTTMK